MYLNSIIISDCFQRTILKTLNLRILFRKKIFKQTKNGFFKTKKNCIVTKRFSNYTRKLLFFPIYKHKKINATKILIIYENFKVSRFNIFPKKLRNFEKVIKSKKDLLLNCINFENKFKNIELCTYNQNKITSVVFRQVVCQNFIIAFQKDKLLEYSETHIFKNSIPHVELVRLFNPFSLKMNKVPIYILSKNYHNLYRIKLITHAENSILNVLKFLKANKAIRTMVPRFFTFSKIEPWLVIYNRTKHRKYQEETRIYGIKKLGKVQLILYKLNLVHFKFFKKIASFFKIEDLKRFFYTSWNVNSKPDKDILIGEFVGKKIVTVSILTYYLSPIFKHAPFFRDTEQRLVDVACKIFIGGNFSIYRTPLIVPSTKYLTNNCKKIKINLYFSKIDNINQKIEFRNEVFFKNFTLKLFFQVTEGRFSKTKKLFIENLLFSYLTLKKYLNNCYLYFQNKNLLIIQKSSTFCSCFLFGIQNCFEVCLIF